MFFDPLYMLLILITLVLSGITSMMVKTAFARGNKIILKSGITGKDVAKALLNSAGITDVKIETHGGFLSDHYNPVTKTLALSKDVYYGHSASAAGVAAHEAGHAVQHAENYAPMYIRSFIVPAAQIGSTLGPYLVIFGIILGAADGVGLGYNIAIAGIMLFAAATFFSIITVPVEFDASSRAKKELTNLRIITGDEELSAVNSVLRAAGLTYVAAAVGAVLNLLYWAYRAGLIGGRRRD
jgi:uncharacterized protein